MDISDIEVALIDRIASAIVGLPYEPGALVNSIVSGTPRVSIYRGWPTPATLDADLAAGICTVTVFPVPGMTRPLPTRLRQWIRTSTPFPTLTAIALGNVVTIGGSVTTGQVVGIARTPPGSSTQYGYAYRPTADDTLSAVASALAAAIPNATVSGLAITLPAGSTGVLARVGVDAVGVLELRHQEQELLVTVWSPSPMVRDAVASAVDLALAQVDHVEVDGIVSGPLVYRSSRSDDASELAQLFRRDLTYSVAYPTALRQTQPTVLFPALSISTPGDPNTPQASAVIVLSGPLYPP